MSESRLSLKRKVVRGLAVLATMWLIAGIFLTPRIHEAGSPVPDPQTGRVHSTHIKQMPLVYLTKSQQYFLRLSFFGPMALFLMAIALNGYWKTEVSNFRRARHTGVDR